MSAPTPLAAIHEIPRAWALTTPQAICLRETSRDITYGELWQAVESAADWLAAEGVGAGKRVLIAGENCAEMIAMLFACSLRGIWPVMVNARLSAREISTIAEHAGVALTLYTTRVSRAAAAHAEAAGAQPCPAQGLAGELRWARRGASVAETGELAARVAALIYTSGTTGAPKGVMVPHRGLLHFARVSAQSRSLAPGDIAYAALPISHIFGLATVLLATLHAGASLCLRPQFDAGDAFAALAEPGVTILQGVPAMFTRLLAQAPARTALRAPRLRYIYTGGAPLDPSLKRQVEAYFGLPLHHGYGITEYAGSLCVTREDSPRQDCSAGFPVDGVELHIGQPGQPANPPGRPGDIHVRGPGVMLGYYREPEQTASALLPGGWLATGDIGYLDEDGALFISGRSKDIIIRSGFNVYPVEVESVINAYPGVRQSAVLGVPENDGNETVVAFIETQPGAQIDFAALDTYLRNQLAPYKRPARLLQIDVIPTTLSGKIQKQALRARL